MIILAIIMFKYIYIYIYYEDVTNSWLDDKLP